MSTATRKPPRVGIDPGHIPPELKALDRWIGWRYERRVNGDGRPKWTKPPSDEHGRDIDAHKPANWHGFDDALAMLDRSSRLDGLGFSIDGDGCNIVGIDLDDCLDDEGTVSADAMAIVKALDSYTEISPSGKGLRIFCRGRLPEGRRRRGKTEMYDSGRYLTVTGRHLDGTPATIEERSVALARVHADVFAAPDRRTKPPAPGRTAVALDASDDALLELARRARNGEKFRALYDAGDASGHPSESEADYALCCMLAFWTQRDPGRVERLWLASAMGRREKVRDRADYRTVTVENAIEATTEVYRPGQGRAPRPAPSANGDGGNGKATGTPRGGEERPEIEVSTRRDLTVKSALKALARDPGIYARGGALVTVEDEVEPVAKLAGGVEMREARGTPRVVPLAESVIGCRLAAAAAFYQWKTDRSGEAVAVDVHVPPWCIKAVAEQGHYPDFRPLRAVAGSPFIRGDGTIVQEPGYDHHTGALYRPSIAFPSVPTRPTKGDAMAAAGRLRSLVRQFPFASDDDFAAWLSGLMTAAARQAIDGAVPGIAVIGNRAGCGKGLLIDVPALIVWGSNVPTFAYPYDAAEANKVKVAIALESIPAVHFDNLTEGTTYGNSALDSAVTSTVVQDRILGTSKTTGRLALRACWWLSGNNVSPGKDAYRRWLPCNLVSDLESPEERDDLDVPNLRAHVLSRRGELVRDVLTILKAHADAGFPADGWAPLGSFEEWDRVVRGAVWFATGLDCCVTRRTAAAESPERLDKLALLEGWSELPGGTQGGLTAEKAIALATAEPDRFPTMHSFLQRKARGGKLPDARQLGAMVRAIQGARLDGMTFSKSGEHRRSALWIVAGTHTDNPVSHGGCESGESGESIRNPPCASLHPHNYITMSRDACPAIKDEAESDSPDSPDSHPGWTEEDFG